MVVVVVLLAAVPLLPADLLDAARLLHLPDLAAHPVAHLVEAGLVVPAELLV